MRQVSVFLGVLALVSLGDQALAQGQFTRDFGDIADSLRVQTSLISRLLTGFAFLLGVATAMMGIIHIKRSADSTNDPASRHVSRGMVFIFSGALMIALPALISSGVLSIFGSTDNVTDAFGHGGVVPFR